MKKYKYNSIFADEICKYINLKVDEGYHSSSYEMYLRIFDRFCIEHNITEPIFSKQHAAQWRNRRETESVSTQYNRINVIKHFLKYLALKGYNVVVAYDLKFKKSDFYPHIYTNEEVKRYFYAVDTYSSLKNKKDVIQYPVLFRILYCCGTRISETLGIRKKDVDLIKGIIILNETKNDNQRYIVLGDDLRELLNQYADKTFYLLDDDDYIFSNVNGFRLSVKTIYECHRIFLKRAGITYIGDGKGPRIHDWRHHMAIYSFKQLADLGFDMYVALPILSAYLGHKTIYATEKYIRLTMELFPYINEKFHDKIAEIFDKDLDNEKN